jgi:hypothetical protein
MTSQKKMRILIIIALILFASLAEAQNLSVFNLDATNFPTLKAKFYAFDANGVQQSPSPNEITVTEDGIQRTVTSITCPPKKDPPPITLGIMVDTYSGIELAKEGAQKLINLISIPPSEAGITMMDHGAFIVQDLTQKQTKLTSAIAKLQPAPGVDLQTMFYAPNAGGVPFVSGRPNKKVLVMITDLHCPLLNLDKAKLYADCAAQNISVYFILLNTSDMGYAKEITDQTGGLTFENVSTSADIDKVTLKIVSSAVNDIPCEITWISSTSCLNAPAIVQFTWMNQRVQTSYSLPSSAVAGFQFSPRTLYLLAKPVGVKFDTTITVTAINSGFLVTNITNTNPSYDINPKSFSLAKGETKSLTVSYTPPDSSYTWTRFDMVTDVCNQGYYTSGSYPGFKPKIPTLKLTHPNGKELFLIESDTIITWSGIPLTDTVKLEYSIDGGKSWKFITDKATGGNYHWHVPNTPSNRCLAKVTQVNNNTGYGWAQNTGRGNHTEGGKGNGIAIDRIGNVYVTGTYNYDSDFGGNKLISNGGPVWSDIFLAKYRPDGTTEWAKSAGGSRGDDGGEAVTVDSIGNIYVTGYYYRSADIGGIILNGAGYNIFLAKYHPDGTVEWAKSAGGVSSNTYDIPNRITLDRSGNIFFTGYFYSKTAYFDGISITNNGDAAMFVAKYHGDGSVEWAKSVTGYGVQDRNIGVDIATDHFGNAYVIGYFQSIVDFGGLTLNSIGEEDIFIAKYQPNGIIDWVRQAGGKSYDNGLGIAIDAVDNIYVTGQFSDAASFSGQVLKAKSANYDIFISKYHPDGSLEWVKSAGGRDWDGGSAITTDPFGRIYVTGFFTDSASFDDNNHVAAGKNTTGIFLARFDENGAVEWLKQAGGFSWNNEGNAIALDGNGNIYVSGTYNNTGYFDNNVLKDTLTDVFLWKTQDPFIQFDISDTLFSIIAPKFSFSTILIDMGKVEVGKEKDSLVRATICNTGPLSLHILGLEVTGGALTEFMVMSGAGDFTLASGECRDVMFTFMPMMTGKMSATITLRTPNGNYSDTIKILGEGIAPILSVLGDVIDFGEIQIGSFKDTIITLALQNIGSTPINFTSSYQLGPDKTQFSIQSGDAPFTLAPGNSKTITFRFTPQDIGRTSGRIGFNYEGIGSPAILSLYGVGKLGIAKIKSSGINFGSLVCDQEKIDTLRILNSGSSNLIITTASISGTDFDAFTFVSSFVPISILPDSAANISIRFKPKKVGANFASVMIHSNAESDSLLVVPLTGVRESADFSVSTMNIDIGIICSDQTKDTSFTLSNTGTVTNTLITAPNNKFTLSTTRIPLVTGEEKDVSIHFNGLKEGLIDEDILLSDSICNVQKSIHITGIVFQATISIPDLSGFPGDIIDVPIILNADTIFPNSTVTKLTVSLHFNSSILAPIGVTPAGTITGMERTILLDLKLPPTEGNIVAKFPFKVMLGTDTMTILNLETPLSGGNELCLQTSSGTFHMLGICPAGGNRLYNPFGQVSIAHIKPNPSKGIIHINIQTSEIGRTQLSIMNLLGEKIASVSDRELAPGSHSFEFDSKNLSAGSYFLLLQTPTVRRLERVDVEK